MVAVMTITVGTDGMVVSLIARLVVRGSGLVADRDLLEGNRLRRASRGIQGPAEHDDQHQQQGRQRSHFQD